MSAENILKSLTYPCYALKCLVQDLPLVNSCLADALNGIYEFLKFSKSHKYKGLIVEHLDTLEGATNIFKTYLKGNSCLHGLMEAVYIDFNKLIDETKACWPMGLTRNDLEDAIKMDFKAEDVDRVLTILDQYGDFPNVPESIRVKLAILNLSLKNIETLQKNVDEAKIDPKWILLWGE